MRSRRLGWMGLCLFLPLAGQSLRGAETPAPDGRAAYRLAAKIDQLVAVRWKERNVQPAELADDAEFFRRVYLDVAGRIPRVQEVREFLNDRNPSKRQLLVERLLESPHYVNHFTNVWRASIIPPNNNQQFGSVAPSFEPWLRKHLHDNTPYDRMVRELLTAPVGLNRGQPQGVRQPFNPAEPTPVAFYQTNEYKPENIAAATSKLFLGVKLECAQCHDHPFAQWKRKQFWEFAAFFSGIQPQQIQGGFVGNVQETPDRREIKIPGTEKVVQARFLNDKEPEWKPGTNSRATLTDWLVVSDNPFFASNATNRMWAHFFGIGLVEPVDEPGEDNPPSHPELLDELARGFAASRFDLKFLIRAITASRTYQLSSVSSHPSQEDGRAFARMAVKGLSPEQLFDSLARATGYRETGPIGQQRFAGFNPQSPRAEFLARFSNQDRRTEAQTSILQALALMNGRFIGDLTDGANLERTETLAAIVDAPFLDTAQRIETLYLSVLTRKPRPAEMERLTKYVEMGGPSKDPKKALADVFWALLNSSEFILNH